MKIEKAVILLAVAVMVVFSTTACGMQNKGNDSVFENKEQDVGTSRPEVRQPESRQPENQQAENQDSNENKEQGAGGFDGQADLEGSVYDFSETGFSLSPAETYDDGDGFVMAQAAPGAEDSSKLVTITYAEDCYFQIIVMDLSTLKEVSREDTTSESIKKQTQVKVYGNCQDTTHWTAEGIIIVRWQ